MGPIAHRRMSRLVTAYLDGEVDVTTAARVREHLALCWWCSQDIEFGRLVKRALRCRHQSSPELGAARLRRWAVTDLTHPREGTP